MVFRTAGCYVCYNGNPTNNCNNVQISKINGTSPQNYITSKKKKKKIIFSINNWKKKDIGTRLGQVKDEGIRFNSGLQNFNGNNFGRLDYSSDTETW